MLFDSQKDSTQLHLQQSAEPATAAPAQALFVTVTLIAINVSVYGLMLISGTHFTAEQMVPWGGNFAPLTESGQWWRLVTACFLHFGFLHIAVNMYVLFQVGLLTEFLFGKTRYLLIYLAAGIAGNIAGLYLHPYGVEAGASGAIFGVYGALLAHLLTVRGAVPRQHAIKIGIAAAFFLAYNLIVGLATPNTDVVAHVAGLLVGFPLGLALARPLVPGRHLQHTLQTLATAAFAVALAFAAVSRLPKISPTESQWSRLTLTGPSVTVGNHDKVVYTDEATADVATRVGQAMLRSGLLPQSDGIVVFSQTASGASISIPFHAESTLATGKQPGCGSPAPSAKVPPHPLPWDDPAVLTSFRLAGPQIADAAGQRPFTIRMLNTKGDLEREIPIDWYLLTIGSQDRVAYSGHATAAEAAALGKALQSVGFFQDRGALVVLSRQEGPPDISFVLQDGAWNAPALQTGITAIGRRIAPAIGGLPITIHLLDTTFQPRTQITIR